MAAAAVPHPLLPRTRAEEEEEAADPTALGEQQQQVHTAGIEGEVVVVVEGPAQVAVAAAAVAMEARQTLGKE